MFARRDSPTLLGVFAEPGLGETGVAIGLLGPLRPMRGGGEAKLLESARKWLLDGVFSGQAPKLQGKDKLQTIQQAWKHLTERASPQSPRPPYQTAEILAPVRTSCQNSGS
eukprot:CAMPEP_0114570796 /NCGR_PEP_ID=MMETSP0114-20121206/17399_1 /TAXON_ID=31324 /ORGANISM="Goniomonas sp, Strain m" /LENGTH=110 /DNA_ID=CAMNT_0001757863 /DNA_START=114 /DNA_END=447 /DNA_ORIENTATION=-